MSKYTKPEIEKLLHLAKLLLPENQPDSILLSTRSGAEVIWQAGLSNQSLLFFGVGETTDKALDAMAVALLKEGTQALDNLHRKHDLQVNELRTAMSAVK